MKFHKAERLHPATRYVVNFRQCSLYLPDFSVSPHGYTRLHKPALLPLCRWQVQLAPIKPTITSADISPVFLFLGYPVPTWKVWFWVNCGEWSKWRANKVKRDMDLSVRIIPSVNVYEEVSYSWVVRQLWRAVVGAPVRKYIRFLAVERSEWYLSWQNMPLMETLLRGFCEKWRDALNCSAKLRHTQEFI